MRCGRCGKNFDEEMYSGICPGCGRFNNRQAETDVSGYFSAKFDDDKISTDAQASAQHAKLHEMYDDPNARGKGAGTHAKLHEAYDTHDAHKAGSGQHKKLHEMYDSTDPHRRRQGGEGEQARARKVLFTTIAAFAVVWIAIVGLMMGKFGSVVVAIIVLQLVLVRRKILRGDGRRGKRQ